MQTLWFPRSLKVFHLVRVRVPLSLCSLSRNKADWNCDTSSFMLLRTPRMLKRLRYRAITLVIWGAFPFSLNISGRYPDSNDCTKGCRNVPKQALLRCRSRERMRAVNNNCAADWSTTNSDEASSGDDTNEGSEDDGTNEETEVDGTNEETEDNGTNEETEDEETTRSPSSNDAMSLASSMVVAGAIIVASWSA